jgi:hypothetical protein
VYEDPNRQSDIERLNTAVAEYKAAFAEKGMMADSGALNQAIADGENSASLQDRILWENAELLGYKRSLNKASQRMFPSEEEITMRAELAEERYFVILMAYDYPMIKKEKKARLLWVTRMSVRSPGNNFTTAMPEMTRVGAGFFGQQRDDISRVRTNAREGRVELGEPRVIGVVEENETALPPATAQPASPPPAQPPPPADSK